MVAGDSVMVVDVIYDKTMVFKEIRRETLRRELNQR